MPSTPCQPQVSSFSSGIKTFFSRCKFTTPPQFPRCTFLQIRCIFRHTPPVRSLTSKKSVTHLLCAPHFLLYYISYRLLQDFFHFLSAVSIFCNNDVHAVKWLCACHAAHVIVSHVAHSLFSSHFFHSSRLIIEVNHYGY